MVSMQVVQRLFVYVVFTCQQGVEAPVLEILLEIIDDIEEPFSIDYLPDVAP